ncbi:MAG: ATP-binding protein [Polyangiales bacterium]
MEHRARSRVGEARIAAVGTAFLRKRPLIVAPFAFGAVLASAFSGAPKRQVVAIAIGVSVMVGAFVIEALRVRDAAHLRRSLLLTTLGIGALSMATGGVRSPFVPILLAPTGVALAAFGARRSNDAIVALVLVLGVLTAVPSPFPPFVSPLDRVLGALAMVVTALLLRAGVGALSEAHAKAATALDLAREDVIAGANARVAALSSMGAKVAHEIKNPLASVRGLVDLVADESEGRTKTRLEVVQREVARIEDILSGYLSFARPLEELRVERVELARIAEDVCAVVEARGADLEVRGEAVIEGDPRRIKEALLNLVTNALEADAHDIEIEIQPGATVVVRDSGRGLSREALERLGTPGFTTREGGTGLGVVLARAAIAQHGGSIAFDSAEGRGTVATIHLPEKPVES